jgi:hypothetical protein
MNLMIILFGVVGYYFLPVRDYPAIDPPFINVSTSYTGANGYHRKPDHRNRWKNKSTGFRVSGRSPPKVHWEEVI